MEDGSFRRSYYAKAIVLPDSVKKGYVDNLPKDELKAICRLTNALDKCRLAGMSPHNVYKVIFEKMMFDYEA